VDGVYTTDPRIEKKAKKINIISYDEMLEFASLGAKVLQSRSVELAKKLNINLVTRSSFNDNEGTLITKEEKMEVRVIHPTQTDMPRHTCGKMCLRENHFSTSLPDMYTWK